MEMFLRLSLLKFFLFFYFLFISSFGKQWQMNGTLWKTWRTAKIVDKGLDEWTNTEEHLELSSVWRRLGPVSERCQTLEVGGSSGASSLHSRAGAWDRMPTTALWSALSSSRQEGQQRNQRKERGWGRGRQKNNSAQDSRRDWGLRTGTSCLVQSAELFCSHSQIIRWDLRNQRWMTIIVKGRNTVSPERL